MNLPFHRLGSIGQDGAFGLYAAPRRRRDPLYRKLMELMRELSLATPEEEARASDHVQWLKLERSDRILTFRYLKCYERYFVMDDGALLLDSSMFGTFPRHVRSIVDQTIIAYASRFKRARGGPEGDRPP